MEEEPKELNISEECAEILDYAMDAGMVPSERSCTLIMQLSGVATLRVWARFSSAE
jgi:hypothetical protein